MLRLWADKVIRICGGLAVLLLLAAQGKVWPWLTLPQPKPDPAASQPIATDDSPPAWPDAGPPPRSQDAGQPSSQPPAPTLASILPDAMPVRWQLPCNRASLGETAGWREGVSARGPLGPAPRGERPTAAADGPAPHWPLVPSLPTVAIGPRTTVQAIRDPAVPTVLLRTGPPRG